MKAMDAIRHSSEKQQRQLPFFKKTTSASGVYCQWEKGDHIATVSV
jgi:hypothetical protein